MTREIVESVPLVSVVTPFYNTREFLAECIESVLRQTWQNFEYVLVDNWSTDGSTEIAESYALRFPQKIRLLRPRSFLPQVPNYNFALSCISHNSKYCKMVQADDWIYPDCLERMVTVAESDPSIGIVSSYYLKGTRVFGSGLPYTTAVVSGREISRLQLTGALYVFGSPTSLLYRADVVRGTSPFFDESTINDDTDADYRTLRNWNFGFVHQVLSFLRVQDDSIRGRIMDFDPNSLDAILQLSKFGPDFLEPDPLARLLHDSKLEYYRFLARRFLAGTRGEFWQFHRSGLKSGGLQLETIRLLQGIYLELLHMVTNPGIVTARLYHRLRDRPNRKQT